MKLFITVDNTDYFHSLKLIFKLQTMFYAKNVRNRSNIFANKFVIIVNILSSIYNNLYAIWD